MSSNIDGYPKTCATCSKPVRAKDNAQREYDHRTGVALAWHTACGRPKP